MKNCAARAACRPRNLDRLVDLVDLGRFFDDVEVLQGAASGTAQSDSTGGSKRKRGRPRKYEDLTEEERKQRRAMDNRHAAKRSYYRRINKMAELEQVRTTTQLCPLRQ